MKSGDVSKEGDDKTDLSRLSLKQMNSLYKTINYMRRMSKAKSMFNENAIDGIEGNVELKLDLDEQKFLTL